MIVRLLRILMAGVIFVFATVAQAQGQDPKLWYVALGTGGAWYEDLDFGGGVSASMDTGFTVNGAFGRYIDDIRVFRLEGEVLYTRSGVGNLGGVPAKGTLSNVGLMFNAYYDVRTGSSWRPYFGGGIGYSRVDFDGLSSAGVTLVNDSDDVFSWQIKVGVAYEFSPSWAVNVGYRYYGTENLAFTGPASTRVTSEGTRISSAELGFRFNF
ncbi:MAG: outer membrane beta-barrel protein [Gammaproteobacteria bacterium]|nr:MAG: outer membrane beta-barrel protein [Gammaproteobacteria bacterium]